MQNEINAKIAELRKKQKLTQEQLGAKLGISGQAVSKWENGESMPDILLLPDLCEILGISIGALLGQSKEARERDVVQNFVEYAREHGRNQALHDAMSRLFNDRGANASGQNTLVSNNLLRIYNGDGMGFFMQGEKYFGTCLNQNGEDVAYFLRVLTDTDCLAVLRCVKNDVAATEAEICEQSGLSAAAVDRALLELMKRGIICCEADGKGKRGYMQAENISGIFMVLAGCEMTGCGGELHGNLWMCHGGSDRE